MSAANLQSLLRFLSQEAKIPLSTAMSNVQALQKAHLDSPETIAKAKMLDIQAIFSDDKIAKQILTAAKRVAKKRAAGEESAPTPKKKQKNESFFSAPEVSPDNLEASLELPSSTADEDELAGTVLFTNRAPLALAFVLTLLKFSMPEQPLSSRLSLAQGYISVTSRARAVYLGIESGKSAEEEGFGEGTPKVMITGKEITVLRRWGYEWKATQSASDGDHGARSPLVGKNETSDGAQGNAEIEEQPALWAMDLEALKKSNNTDPIVASTHTKSGADSTLPIYRPQSARAYLLKAFDLPPTPESEKTTNPKKTTAAARVALKEQNLGKLLTALDMLYKSWATTLSGDELDKRTWGWYVKVRPDVADGVAGWGGKNNLRLADILALRRVEK